MSETIGLRIRIARVRKGLTQKELAEKIAITQNGMSLIEHGSRDLRVANLRKIADVLDVSMDYLCGRTERETVAA